MDFDFSEIKVLVIGDFMVDHYLIGNSNRKSPEADVPVVIPIDEFSIAGGAGNVAINLSSLGAKVTCAGVIGNDHWGKILLEKLNENDISTQYIENIKELNTTVKKRIYSNNQQVARVDIDGILKKKCSFMDNNFNDFDLIILSDYDKGVINKTWFKKPKDTLVMIDPKKHESNFRQCDIITPNLKELEHFYKKTISNDEDIIGACKHLINNYKFKYVIAKKGKDGITVVDKNGTINSYNAEYVESPDVTGAGDTVISSLGLALIDSGNIDRSVRFAIIAAGIAVNKRGTANVTIDEINNYIRKNEE